MAYKVFIDGSAGTTGLRIYQRLGAREDIELLSINENQRKDIKERTEKINSADVAFLCLPDAAAKEIVTGINSAVKVLDTSTAHRTAQGWVYGLPELYSGAQRQKIKAANRVAVPGCHATGFIALAAPLVALGIAPADYPFTAHSVTGYSGGGKSMIADYEQHTDAIHASPRQYALGQTHKHLPEMQKISNLSYAPVFNPIVSNFYSGMVVTVPLYMRLLAQTDSTPQSVAAQLAQYYANQPMITVHMGTQMPESGFLETNTLAGSDKLEIFVFGTKEQIVLASRFDNLGKGSSGAALQCMNLMLGLPETTGLCV
ncbi:MAG: N-acetyl-gamma-glutamyl-phosphate reductase [Oscillospiraceae bacterium]|nr:N-acetyl-gamma-glutamyl-phosphate reductase [Oscillospiraceae bacterium]